MADRPRFGPAGKPPHYSGPTVEVPQFLQKEGLDAFEYQAVRGVRIKQEEAESLGNNAKKSDVWLSLHGPYYVNLSGERDVIKKSKKRLVDSLRAASWMGARQVVYHLGYYGMRSEKEALELCIKAMEEIVEEAKGLGIKGVLLGPETTGKATQVGSLEEILTMCERVEMTVPTIDWAHLHARSVGLIKTKDDYMKIVETIEGRLGRRAVENFHCHYTPVEFTEKGERSHHTMEESEFGPDFRLLAEIIAEQGLNPVIISESPLLDLDSIKMKRMIEEALKGK